MRAQPAAKPTVLVVDDVPQNLVLLTDILASRYAVKVASSGTAALKIMAKSPPPDLVLLDVMMPDMDGYGVCRRLKADVHSRDVPVIFLTVLDDSIDEALGLGVGAADFISKPVSAPIMLARIDVQLRLKATADALAEKSRSLEREVARRTGAMEQEHEAIVDALVSRLRPRTRNGSNRAARVRAMLEALAGQLQQHPRFSLALTDEARRLMGKAVPLCDVCRADVPDRAVFKTDPLAPDEADAARLQADQGCAMFRQIERRLGRPTALLQMAAEMALGYLERHDGRGPQRLVGDAVPVSARLLAVVDTYEGLTSGCTGRQPASHEEAMAQVEEDRGTRFDPLVVDALSAIGAEVRDIARCLADAPGEGSAGLLPRAPG